MICEKMHQESFSPCKKKVNIDFHKVERFIIARMLITDSVVQLSER